MPLSAPPLIAVRHTPVLGGQGICYGGKTDLEVLDREVADAARRLRLAIPDWPIVSSPLQRCHRLAEATALGFRISPSPRRGVPASPLPMAAARAEPRAVQVDARIAELHFGDWEGQAWSMISRADRDDWAANPAGYRIPGGESHRDLEARVSAALADMTGPTIWFTHAGVIRALHHLLSDMGHEEALRRRVPYATPLRF